MGYTHYWNNSEFPQDEWNNILADAKALIAAADIALCRFGDDNDSPALDSEGIILNGWKDEGHETFALSRYTDDEFCKTAAKPYDLLVASILAVAADRSDHIAVSSDGGLDDWADALRFASETLGREIAFPCGGES